MVSKQFGLGYGIEIREFWSKIGYQLPGKLESSVANLDQHRVEKLRNKC